MNKTTFSVKIILTLLLLCIGVTGFAQQTEIDLQVTKEVNATIPSPGDVIQYTIKVKNLNNAIDGTGLIIKDLLPTDVTFVSVRSIQNGTTYNNSTGFWNIGFIEKNKEYQLKIDARINANTAAKIIVNTASVYAFNQYDPNTDNNTASATVTIPGADLQVVKTVSNNSPRPGDEITYTIVVTNNGPDEAKNIEIKDLLPAGLTFVSSTRSQGNAYVPSTGIWYADKIRKDLTATLTITARVNANTLGQTITNTASVFSVQQPDGITNNNSSSVDIYILEADLTISKTVSNPLPSEGDIVTYTINYTNSSIYNAPYVKITDLLPANVIYLSNTSPGGGYNPTTGVFNLGTLPAMTSGTFTINVQVSPNTGGFTVVNTANISSPAFDPNTANNTSSATFQVSGADLAVTKTVNNTTPSEGDIVIYTVTVKNNGPDRANNVNVDDRIPNNLANLTFTFTQGDYQLSQDRWRVGALNNGQTATMTVRGVLDRSGTFINVATASSNKPDGNQNNNRAQVTVNSFHTFSAGACIINMGIVPQTYNNGLKPYGLVYELANVHDIPIYWAIKPDKTWGPGMGSSTTTQNIVNQADFSVNGKEYKGGPFIIPSEYMTVLVRHPNGSGATITVRDLITYWMGQFPGLSIDCERDGFVAPVHDVITRFPRAVLDTQNGSKLVNAFYQRARLYETQFSGGANPSYRVASPSQLNDCDDMFGLPHADPHDWNELTEQVHLKNWIKTGGYLWMACHAASSMEGLVDISAANDPDGMDMRLLTKNGLVEWRNHNNSATPPFDYSLEAGIFNANVAADPLMQFIGKVDGALSGGSEEIYLVKPEGYRPTTVFPVRDLDHPQTQPGGAFPPGPAASVVYGRAFGKESYGMVMYEASHSFASGTEAENVSAARIYGNMLLQGGIERNPKIIPGNNEAPRTACIGTTFLMDMRVEGIGSSFTFEWSSSIPGTFSGPLTGSVSGSGVISNSFTTPSVTQNTISIIRLKITDNCGRQSFLANPVLIYANPVPTITPTTNRCINEEKVHTTEPGMTNYIWNVIGGVITAGGTTNAVTVNWNTLGTGTIKVTYTDQNGCTGSTTKNIVVNNTPIAGNITGNSELCPGNSTTLVANATGTGTLTYTWASSNPAVATVSNTGVVTGVSSGSTNIRYTVTASSAPDCPTTSAPFSFTVLVCRTLVANNDSYSATFQQGLDGRTFSGVLNNDTLDGNPVNAAEITLTSTPTSALSINSSNGNITVAPGTAPGTYTINYTICENAMPSNCKTAIATVIVGNPTPMVAQNDSYNASFQEGVVGITFSDVLDNDTLNGSPINAADIILTSTPTSELSINSATGDVIVAPNTAPGVYSINYRICERTAPGNCKNATATVTVGDPNPIIAEDETYNASFQQGVDGITFSDVLDNDTFNGAAINLAEITLTATPTSILSIDPNTGDITVAPGTAPGTYTIDYTLCETAAPTNCKTATATVKVRAAIPIVATNDAYIATFQQGINGTTFSDILDNDTLDSAAINSGDVTISSTSTSYLSINPTTGVVTLAPGTGEGTYTINYTICQTTAPANCDSAIVTVVVKGRSLMITNPNIYHKVKGN